MEVYENETLIASGSTIVEIEPRKTQDVVVNLSLSTGSLNITMILREQEDLAQTA